MSIVTAQRSEMCYCPGCSHGMVLEHIGRALDRLGRRPEDVCIVSDIGCIGTADRYFACHTFHGLHGRSITYAEGIKRFRPDLLVIVLIGDGGCGIGTAHLVHAARRNADIKVIVCNNFNFGMTGGQHSPTTPTDASTATTPGGAADQPFDICATVAANGAAYVARHSAFEPNATDMILQGLSAPGFALLDLWELCTAYFVPANQLNKSSLAELSERLRMPLGVLHQNDRAIAVRPAPAAQPPAPQARPVPTDARTTVLAWAGRREICVAGSAGQRIRSAVGVIGELAVSGGLFAAQQDDFPITVRKGFSISNLIVDGRPIHYTGVDDPDLVLILSQDGLDRFGSRLPELGPACTVVADRSVQLPPVRCSTTEIDMSALGKGAGRASAALAALVYGTACAGYFASAELARVADVTLHGPYRDANLTAIRVGLELAAEERQRPASPS